MEKEKYHHGNLKSALIEAGIEIMNTSGEAGLSMRKLATVCGTSQAAPYAHFKNKEELLAAMQDHVTEQIYHTLCEAIEVTEGAYDCMIKLGEAYIMFFIEHPTYFKFLCFSSHIQITLSNEESENCYPPFQVFQKTAIACLKEFGCKEENYLYCMTNMWATVQGIALLATQPNVNYQGEWKEDLHLILTNAKEEA